MSLIQLAFLGALIGLPLGYALQRTKLCFNIAYREVILYGRTMLLRLIGLAVLIQMIGLALLIQFNVGGVSLNIVPFYLIAAMLGGFIFGLSMVYAEGCSSTVWYRVQIPNLSSMARMFAAGLTMDLSANIAGGVQHWAWLHRCTNPGVEQPDGNNIYFLTRLAGKLLALYPRPAHPTIQDQNQPLIQPGPSSPDQ